MYWNVTDEQRLLLAFMLADTPDLLQNLLDDILTEKEYGTLIKRLKIACLIHSCASYKEIESLTGQSSATISEIAKKLTNKRGGYYKILSEFTKDFPSYFD